MLNIRGRRRAGLPVNAEINITNLVDVAFVLLIIFMITAPILQGGIEVQLPQAEAAPITSSQSVIVSIAQDGRVFIDQTPLSLAEFPTAFQALMGKSQQRRTVSLKADKGVPYGRVMEVLGIMKKLDVADVGLVVEPLPQGK